MKESELTPKTEEALKAILLQDVTNLFIISVITVN